MYTMNLPTTAVNTVCNSAADLQIIVICGS